MSFRLKSMARVCLCAGSGGCPFLHGWLDRLVGCGLQPSSVWQPTAGCRGLWRMWCSYKPDSAQYFPYSLAGRGPCFLPPPTWPYQRLTHAPGLQWKIPSHLSVHVIIRKYLFKPVTSMPKPTLDSSYLYAACRMLGKIFEAGRRNFHWQSMLASC